MLLCGDIENLNAYRAGFKAFFLRVVFLAAFWQIQGKSDCEALIKQRRIASENIKGTIKSLLICLHVSQ